MNIHVSPQYTDDVRAFFERYDLHTCVAGNAPSISLLPKERRVCRFCKGSYPNVTFKKNAHLLPEFLGNRTLLSDFECDVCNAYFSKFENDFANRVAIGRTVHGIKGK